MQAGCLKIAPLSALLTSLKELSWSSSHEAQRWLDDGYQGESIPLSKQHLGVITPVTEKQEDLIFIIFLWGVSSSSWTNWFNTVKNWKGRIRHSGLWYCFNWWWETKERHHKDLNNQSQSFLQTTDTPEVDIRTKRDIPHSHYCICLLADLLGGVGGGDITTGHKAAKRLTAVGRFPAFFVQLKPAIFSQEVRPSLPIFVNKTSFFARVKSNHLQLFLWGQSQMFLRRPGDIFVATKAGYFTWEVGPSPSIFVTKQVFLKGDLETHPAIFVETKADYFSVEVNPSLTRLFFQGDLVTFPVVLLADKAGYFARGNQTISSCFWATMPIDFRETRGHFQTFLWRLKSAL